MPPLCLPAERCEAPRLAARENSHRGAPGRQDRASAGLLEITPSHEWVRHFRQNARHQRAIPWERGAEVTPGELAAVASSLRGWQLGETSDGSHLIRAAQQYAAHERDPDFLDAARCFIAEEQRHGEMLGRFLDLAGVQRAESNWGDSLFRLVRYSFASMEVWVTPVVMVETHALVYYNALRRATRSAVLRGVCQQILADEVKHIHFQCQRLAMLHRRRAKWLRLLTMAGQRLLFAVMTVAIWLGHHRALRAGGYDFWRFWRSAWTRMRYAWRIMNPLVYRTGAAPVALRRHVKRQHP